VTGRLRDGETERLGDRFRDFELAGNRESRQTAVDEIAKLLDKVVVLESGAIGFKAD